MMKKPLIIIAGPTACGKTSASIALAKKINGEIISADSMQVYKYMNIGTAKPTKEEMNGVPHYLIDELLPDEEFNVMIFQKMAKHYINMIYEKNKIPIIVGGTGFYINALVYDNNFMSTNSDEEFRKTLYQFAEENGACALHKKLQEIDMVSAEKIHPNNIKRVARAIEYYHLTKEPISKHNETQREKQSPYHTAFIILNMQRQKLYDNIEKRVDNMINQGLVNEVEHLLKMGYSSELVSMQGLGYKEIIPFIQGDISLSEAVYELKKGTRHFAKRQLTWFRRQTEGDWIDLTNLNKECIIDCIYKKLAHLNI